MRSSLLASLLLCSCFAVDAATVYRWTDGDGQTHFSQVAPPAGTPYEVIQTQGGAGAGRIGQGQESDNGDAGPSQEQRTREFLERREAENRAREEARAREQEARQTAERKCDQARDRVRFLEERTARRLVIPAEDGNLARMEEDEFMRRLDTAREQVETHCR